MLSSIYAIKAGTTTQSKLFFTSIKREWLTISIRDVKITLFCVAIALAVAVALPLFRPVEITLPPRNRNSGNATHNFDLE